uniref:B-block binding subunit of TFIIIC domain-containing protein n=1 Tax=Astatotilapia calliptera TaxID=8154 RepID=A0AAX7SKG7_ASTCA
MDLLSIVVDEVALEGLDGITIPTLWIRLEDRQPGFPLKLDDCTKELIWKSLVINSDLLFYELPEERDDVVLTDRFKDIDAETGIEVTDSFTDTPKDIYPIDVVENKDGIQGSCAFFKTRKDVTKQVRSKSPLTPLVSLSEALERYGRKLVVVASQCLRYRALIGSESDPDVKLGSDSYCVLERVGRARWQGELQRDLHGGSFKVDARKFHYFRKSLVRYQLVTMQSYVRRMKTGQQQHSILLLLKRFHVNRRTKYDILMEVTSNFLQQCPNQFSTVIMLREQLNVDDRTYLRLFKYMRASKLIEFCRFPLEELDPSAGPRTNKNGNATLKNHISLTVHELLSSGTKGIPQRDIAFRLNVSKLEARMLWRRLEKDGLIKVTSGHMLLFFLSFCPSLKKRSRLKIEKAVLMTRIAYLEVYSIVRCVSASHPHDQRSAEETSSTDASSLHQSETPNAADNAAPITVVVKSIPSPKKASVTRERSHETYRLLRRKNLIVEAVCNLRIIEGLFQLQKMINDDEKQDGVSSKCCKKTIVRLVHCLAREGLLKIYTTTVVQDGMTRKVEMIVHPSIQPNNDRVKQVIEQVRFRISSSSAQKGSQCLKENFKRSILPHSESLENNGSKMQRNIVSLKTFAQYSVPLLLPGLSKTYGFQPKMHRLRMMHTFLWYLIYGHPLRHNCSSSDSTSQSSSGADGSDPAAKPADSKAQQDLKEAEIYLDEDSWKRFIPPVRVHEEYSSGWAMVGDLLLCLPLSVFVQIIQVTYKVEGLEEYLNDPVKQHHLVRALPARMRRRLLYKRKYIFVFHENLLKLVYMGLLQFGPIEKFMEKDQVFVYLKRNATIVDTTNTEPHYWLVTECLEKPFERRPYVFNTADDLEKYWFDLMCVCLNTPLGVVRCKRNTTDEETTPSFVQEQTFHTQCFKVMLMNVHLSNTHRGSTEVCDDGLIPGDGKGAGGLDSEFFGHLKRNWFWTNQLLSVNMVQTQYAIQTVMCMLNRLLFVFLFTDNQVGIEPASRNQRVVGGKGQKRKRTKKDVVKVPRKKKKEPKKRTPAHDETDHQALKRMTRQRVNWTVQEDSLVMLCCVAADLLNSKLKRQFVPHCVVRDLLHAEFEISSDKTSVAVGRRSRYILKNPQTLLNYRICLAEVYQDKSLMSLLEKEKPDCAKVFSEYIRLLRQKFSTIVNAHDLIIPDTKQQLFSRFKVSAIDSGKKLPYKDTLNSTDDIHSVVLHNLIQSTLAMTNNQMKTSRSFQIFHLYSQYDQELLCKVFIQCRTRGLVNRRRISQQFGPKKNRALPILPMSYQLSQSYFRCFSWRFPHSLCTDSFRFLRMSATSNTVPPASDEPPDVSDMLKFSLQSPGGACLVSLSLMSLGLLNVYASIPKQMVVVDSNLVDKDVVKSMAELVEEEEEDDDDGDDYDGKKRQQVKAQKASHTKYLMMRGYCTPGIVKVRNLNTNDSIVMESCIMRLQLRNTPAHSLFNFAPLDLTKCGPSLLPSNLTSFVRSASFSPPSVEECYRRFVNQKGYTPRDIEACTQIMRSLDEAGERGWDAYDFLEAHANLLERQSGRSRKLQHTKFNHTKVFVFPFINIPSFISLLFASSETSFISRPWRLVDGKVNRQVCKGMLEAVLYHIMSQPGLTHQALVEHYKDLLQPVAVQDLVQALIELGCVTKKTLAKSPKPSLFTRPAQQRKSEREPDIVMYEPTISCCLRLCRVLPNERTWNCCIP